MNDRRSVLRFLFALIILFNSIPWAFGAPDVLTGLQKADAFFFSKKYKLAVAAYNNVLNPVQDRYGPNSILVARVQRSIALSNMRLGNQKSAVEAIGKALEIAAEKASPKQLIQFKQSQHAISLTFDLKDEAAKQENEIIGLSKTLWGGGSVEHATLLGALGFAYLSESKNKAPALRCYNQSLKLFGKDPIKNRPLIALVHSRIGDVHNSMGKPVLAVRSFESALAIFLSMKPLIKNKIEPLYRSLSTLYLWQTNDYEKAIDYSKKAIPLTIELYGKENAVQQTYFTWIGYACLKSGKYKESVKAFSTTDKLTTKSNPTDLYLVNIRASKSEALYKSGDIEAARRELKNGEALSKKVLKDQKTKLAEKLSYLALTSTACNDHEHALKLYSEAIDLLKAATTPNAQLLAKRFNDLGYSFERVKKIPQSIDSYRECLKYIALDNKVDPLFRIDVLENLGRLLTLNGNSKESVNYLERAVEAKLRRSETTTEALGLNYGMIAQGYNAMFRSKKALENANKSISILNKIGITPPIMAETYQAAGTSHLFLGNYDKSLAMYKRAIDVTRGQANEKWLMARGYFFLGNGYMFCRDYSSAIDCFNKTISILDDVPNGKLAPGSRLDLWRAHGGLSSVYFMRKKFELAKKHIQIAHKILPSVNTPLSATTELTLSQICAELGDHKNARKHMDTAKRGLPKDDPYSTVMLSWHEGYMHHISGNSESAKSKLEGAFLLAQEYFPKDHKNLHMFRDRLIKLYLEADRQKALQLARVDSRSYKQGLIDVFSFAPERIRLAYTKDHNPFDYFANLETPNDIAQSILRFKGAVLASIIEDRRLLQRSRKDPELLVVTKAMGEIARRHSAEIATSKNPKRYMMERENDEPKLVSLIERAGRLDARYGTFRKSLEVRVDKVQQMLNPATALIEYISFSEFSGAQSSERFYGAVVITKTNVSWVKLGATEGVDGLVSKYLPTNKISGKDYEINLKKLHDVLIGKLTNQLTGQEINELIVSPSGQLNIINFSTLLTREDKFLSEKYTIKHIGGGRDLIADVSKVKDKGSLIIFASPNFEKVAQADNAMKAVNSPLPTSKLERDLVRGELSFAKLPGAEVESTYLEVNSKKWGLAAKRYSGLNAGEEKVYRLNSPYILHFATHGFFLPIDKKKEDAYANNPMQRSGLALAGAKRTLSKWQAGEIPYDRTDGVLTASEVAQLNLDKTWLVTLSACNTGRGEIIDGEGVMGLRRAFIQSGAQNVLMTLWPVSDKYTTDFIKAFYDRAMADGDAPQALADVQRDLLVKYRREFKSSKIATKLAVQIAGPFVLSFQGSP